MVLQFGNTALLLRVYSCFLEFSTLELIPNRKGTNITGSECAPICIPGQRWSWTTKQIPVMLCDLKLGDLSISQGPHCYLPLLCQSHLTAVATETFSFSLDVSPSCFIFPTVTLLPVISIWPISLTLKLVLFLVFVLSEVLLT